MADGGFWPADWWLPAGIEWIDLENFEKTGHNISKAADLRYIPLYAIVVIGIRVLFERYFGIPLAAYMGVKVILIQLEGYCPILFLRIKLNSLLNRRPCSKKHLKEIKS